MTHLEKLKKARAKEAATLQRLHSEMAVKMEHKKIREDISKIKAAKRRAMFGGDIGKTIGKAFKGTGKILKSGAKAGGKFMLAYGAELEKQQTMKRKQMSPAPMGPMGPMVPYGMQPMRPEKPSGIKKPSGVSFTHKDFTKKGYLTPKGKRKLTYAKAYQKKQKKKKKPMMHDDGMNYGGFRL